MTGQAIKEAEHPHQVIVAAAQVIAEAEMLIRIALQIGHVDVVEHVKAQRIDHHNQQVAVGEGRIDVERPQRIADPAVTVIALVGCLLLVLIQIQPAMFGQEGAGRHGVGEGEVGALHGDGLIQGGIRPAVDHVGQDKADQQRQPNLIAVLTALALVDFAPDIGRQQQLQQEDGRHGDEDDAPDRALLGLGLIQQQLPHLGIEVELEEPEYLGVDQQKHQRQRRHDGGDEAQGLLFGQHEAQREDRQQVGDET